MIKKGFTLIELLVVIAIIAILAAILFPVFARAKEAAKKTQSLSNVKEIATAMHLYMNDSDDMTPATYIAADKLTSVDVYQTMQPYMKNMDLFFSPVWDLHSSILCDNTATYSGAFVPNAPNRDRCVGYGYNWGFGVWAGGALVGANRPTDDGGGVLVGVSGTSADNPAQLAAFGDSYSGRRYAMSAVGSTTLMYDGPTKNESLRHGGQFNYAYLDGHAKSIKMQGYTFNPAATPKGAGYIVLPANNSLWVPTYCLTADTTVDAGQLVSQGTPGAPAMNMSCQQLIAFAMVGGLGPKPTPWAN